MDRQRGRPRGRLGFILVWAIRVLVILGLAAAIAVGGLRVASRTAGGLARSPVMAAASTSRAHGTVAIDSSRTRSLRSIVHIVRSGEARASAQLGLTTPTITWTPSPSTLTYGTGLVVGELNAVAKVAGVQIPGAYTYTWSTPPVTVSPGFVLPAGSQTLTVNFSPANTLLYLPVSASVVLTVSPAPLTVTADNQSMPYGGPLPTLTDKVSGLVNGDALSVVSGSASCSTMATSTSANGTSYPITCSRGTLSAVNYSFPAGNFVPGTLSVGAAPLTATVVGSQTYGGPPSFTVSSYSVLLNGDLPSVVTGTLSCSTDATAQSVVGHYSVTGCSGLTAANYLISYADGGFTVNAAPLTVTADNQSKAYGAALPALTVSYAGFQNGETAAALTTRPAVTTTATKSSHVVGNPYAITASGAAGGNYTISYVAGALTVTPVALTVTADSKSMTYGGGVPALTAGYAGFANSDTATSLTTLPTLTTAATSASSVAAGPYPITASGASDSDYTIGYVAGSLTVDPAPLTVTADNQSMTYGGPLPTLTDKVSGLVNGDALSVASGSASCSTMAMSTSANGTSYPITCSRGTLSAVNYSFPAGNFVPGTLSVGAAPLTATVVGSQTYGGPPSFTVSSYSVLLNGDLPSVVSGTLSCSTDATAQSAVGHYSVTGCSGLTAANYLISYADGGFTVNAAPLTATVTGAQLYGAAPSYMAASYQGFVNGDDGSMVSGTPSCSTSVTAATDAGSYAGTISGCSGLSAANYLIGYADGGFTVNKAPLTVNADNQTMPYGGPVPTLTYQVSGFVNGDTVSVVSGGAACTTTATVTSPKGTTYPITCAIGSLSAANYSFPSIDFIPGTLGVGVAPLTATVTGSQPYGGTPSFAVFAWKGFQNGDGAEVVSGTLTCHTNVSVTTPAGSYAGRITGCSGLTTANYVIGYADGGFTVNPAALTATVAGSQTYGGSASYLVTGYQEFVDGEGASVVSGVPSCTANVTARTPVGTYAGRITGCSGLSAANYLIGYADGGFRVSPAPLSVGADNKTMSYGGPLPALTYHVTGFVNGETVSVVSGSAACTTTAKSSSPAGRYPITCTLGTLSAANYMFSAGRLAPGVLTVTNHQATLGFASGRIYSTGRPTAATTSVVLKATMAPAAGGTVDRTKARVAFLLYRSSNSTMTRPDRTCIAAVTAAGVASCRVATLGVDAWTVVAMIPASNAYFAGPHADPVILTVYAPSTGDITAGGGWVTDPSASVSASHAQGNYGFSARRTGTGAPQGAFVYAFRGADGNDYIVRGTGLPSTLNFGTASCGVGGRATVVVINPTTGLRVSGLGGPNYAFSLMVTDKSATADTFALSVHAPNGALWRQAGTNARPLSIAGGDVFVHI